MPKSIQGSVGLGGKNQWTDVMVVQYLLNCVPSGKGGPSLELAVDGAAGPKTTQAIRNFQTANLKFADGRVDPLGQTIAALQKFDPYPSQPFQPAGTPSGGGAGGGWKQGSAPSGGKTGGGLPFGGKDSGGWKVG